MGLGRVVLVNGTTAVGKTTACNFLLNAYAGRGDVAVLDRDSFETFRGVLSPPDDLRQVEAMKQDSLSAIVAAAKSFAANGVTVYASMFYGVLESKQLLTRLAGTQLHRVCLQPSWDEAVSRRKNRMSVSGADELTRTGWQHQRKFYDELALMIESEMFDKVVDTTALTPEDTALVLATYLPRQAVIGANISNL